MSEGKKGRGNLVVTCSNQRLTTLFNHSLTFSSLLVPPSLIKLHREFDIVRLTAETYIKYFILTLESNRDIISSDEAVEHASKTVFSLYKKLLSMDRRYGKLVPR